MLDRAGAAMGGRVWIMDDKEYDDRIRRQEGKLLDLPEYHDKGQQIEFNKRLNDIVMADNPVREFRKNPAMLNETLRKTQDLINSKGVRLEDAFSDPTLGPALRAITGSRDLYSFKVFTDTIRADSGLGGTNGKDNAFLNANDISRFMTRSDMSGGVKDNWAVEMVGDLMMEAGQVALGTRYAAGGNVMSRPSSVAKATLDMESEGNLATRQAAAGQAAPNATSATSSEGAVASGAQGTSNAASASPSNQPSTGNAVATPAGTPPAGTLAAQSPSSASAAPPVATAKPPSPATPEPVAASPMPVAARKPATSEKPTVGGDATPPEGDSLPGQPKSKPVQGTGIETQGGPAESANSPSADATESNPPRAEATVPVPEGKLSQVGKPATGSEQPAVTAKPTVAEKPPSGSVFRGDINHKPGSGPIGKPLSEMTDAERAQAAYDHVKQNAGHDDSPFKSFSERADFARDRFAKWSPKDSKGDPKRVTKVTNENLQKLQEDGKVRVYSPKEVEAMLNASGDPKLAKQAGAIRAQMERHEELLVEGLVPPEVQKPLK